MLLEFQRTIERALALHAPIKACYIRTDKPKFLLQEKWLCEETKRQFSRISDDETKNDVIRQKEKQLLSSFMELNSEKARWKFIQDLRNKKKTQARIPSLLNSFGDKITKPMEIANLLNYRFSNLGEFIGLQQTSNIPPKTAPRKCFKFRYMTTEETNVLIDSLITSKPVGHSKIPSWAIKDAKAALAEPLCYLINQFITEDHKKACVTPLFKKRNPEDPLNYRPISVTSALSKIFEKAFSSQIKSFLERDYLLSASQFGYRKHISTIDAILKSTEQIRLELNKKKMLQGRFYIFQRLLIL